MKKFIDLQKNKTNRKEKPVINAPKKDPPMTADQIRSK